MVKEHWPTSTFRGREVALWENRGQLSNPTSPVFTSCAVQCWPVKGDDSGRAGWQHQHVSCELLVYPERLDGGGSRDCTAEATKSPGWVTTDVEGKCDVVVVVPHHSFRLHMCDLLVILLSFFGYACLCVCSVHDQSTSCLVQFAFVQKLHLKEGFMFTTFFKQIWTNVQNNCILGCRIVSFHM